MAGKAAPKKKKNPSAIKRVRQAEKNRLRNKAVKTTIKTFTKRAEAAVSNGTKEEIQKTLTEAASVINKAATKGVIHKNTASRKISRLAKLANTASKTSAA